MPDGTTFIQGRAWMRVHLCAFISISRGDCQANCGYLSKCSFALKLRPQACPAAARKVILEAIAASATLFWTAPAGSYGAFQSPMPRTERSTWPQSVLSLGTSFFATES